LTVHGGHSKSVIGEPRARRLEHVARNVDADHEPRRPDSSERDRRGLARPHPDVENPLADRDLSRCQYGRYEQTGPATEVLLVREDIHPLAGGNVEAWSQADFRPGLRVHSGRLHEPRMARRVKARSTRTNVAITTKSIPRIWSDTRDPPGPDV